MLKLDIHQEFLCVEPDVVLHVEGAIVAHDVEDDCLGGQLEVCSKLHNHNCLGISLHKTAHPLRFFFFYDVSFSVWMKAAECIARKHLACQSAGDSLYKISHHLEQLYCRMRLNGLRYTQRRR